MSEDSTEINEYNLTINMVKMKVKFPCRMKIQHSSNAITDQVQSQDQLRFVFNQQVTIQQQTQKETLQMNVILVTQKGSKYVSGIIKISLNELNKSQGQKIVCQLIKCLDSDAYCQINVSRVKLGHKTKRISISNKVIQLKRLNSGQNKVSTTEQKSLLSPNMKRTLVVETRSQIGFKGVKIGVSNDWEDSRSKGAAQTLIYKSSFLRSPKSKHTAILGSPKSRLQFNNNNYYHNNNNNINNQFQYQQQTLSTNRDNPISKASIIAQSEIHRQGYEKLKQKYKKQSQLLKTQQSKRMQLQANQNSYKIQIMRLKLKSQQQQRTIQLKSQKVNQLMGQISQMNKQGLDVGYLKQESDMKQEKIRVLGDVIRGLKKQLQQVKRLGQQNSKQYTQMVDELRNQLQLSKKTIQNLTLQHQQQQTKHNQQIKHLSQQIRQKLSIIQTQKLQIQMSQSLIPQRLFQFEKTLQQVKAKHVQEKNQLKLQVQKMRRLNKQLQLEINKLNEDKQRMKAIVLKAQLDTKVTLQQMKHTRQQLTQHKQVNQKLLQTRAQLQLTKQQNTQLTKQLHLLNESKQINLQQVTECHVMKVKHYQQLLQQMQRKNKQLIRNKLQLQSQLESGNNTLQKQKRTIESLNSQLLLIKQTVKQYRQHSSQLEQRLLAKQTQLSIQQNKLKYTDQSNKLQQQKILNQLQQYKSTIKQLQNKIQLLSEQKSTLQTQLTKCNINLKYHQGKMDKLYAANKEYLLNMESNNKEHQLVVKECNERVSKMDQDIKRVNQQLHKRELSFIQVKDLLESTKKDSKVLQEKITFQQLIMKNKSEQYNKLQQKYCSTQNSLNNLITQHNLLKTTYTKLQTQLAKQQKIIQIKSIEVNQSKQQVKRLNIEISLLQKKQGGLIKQVRERNEMIVKLQVRIKTIQREYGRFREHMSKVIATEFARLPLLVMMDKGNNNNNISGNNNNNNNNNRTSLLLENSKLNININNNESIPFALSPLQTNNNSPPINNISTSSLNNTSIITPTLLMQLLTTSITTNRQTLLKLIQHNRQLKKQLQQVKQQSQQTRNKHEFNQMYLHKGMLQMQQQLNTLYQKKQQQLINNDKLVYELSNTLQQKQLLIEQLTQQIEHLSFVISTMKVDFDNYNMKSDSKCCLLQKVIRELEEKVDECKYVIVKQQDKRRQLQDKLEGIKMEIQLLNQTKVKLQLNIENKQNNINQLQLTNMNYTKQRKLLIQQLHELQHKANEQTQSKLTIMKLLTQQQHKNKQHIQFVSTLIKQKQTIMKSQLQKSQQILQLQGEVIELKRLHQLISQELSQTKRQLLQYKQKHKLQSVNNRTLNTQLQQTIKKVTKLQERLIQRQKQLLLKQDIISKQNNKYKQLTQKKYKQTLELQQQIQDKCKENVVINKEMAENVLKMQAKIQELQDQRAKSHSEILVLHQQLLKQRQLIQEKNRQLHRLHKELQRLNDQHQQQTKTTITLTQQLQLKQQHLSQINQQLIIKQQHIQQLQKTTQLNKHNINSQWTNKYNLVIEQHQQQIQMLMNEKQMVRSQLQQKINQLQFATTINRHQQISIDDIRLNYQHKIKLLQKERLQVVVSKNIQIKKIEDSNILIRENNKLLEMKIKDNIKDIQMLNKKILSLEKLNKQLQEKIKTITLLCNTEITNLRQKQTKTKTQLQAIYQNIWNNQRQVRKILQNHMKTILEHAKQSQFDAFFKAFKILQDQVLNAITDKITTVAV